VGSEPANKDLYKVSFNPTWNNRFHRHAKCWKVDDASNCMSLQLKLSSPFIDYTAAAGGVFQICADHLSVKLALPASTIAVGEQYAITCFEKRTNCLDGASKYDCKGLKGFRTEFAY